MIQFISEVNWLGILAAFIAYSVLGALWFTLFFKKQYAKSLGKENEKLQNSAPVFFIGPAVCSLLITITSSLLMHALEIDSYAEGLEFALIVGVGYLFSNTVNIAINPNMPKPIPYGLISGFFHLVGILIVCTILVAMG
ncbi:MAG: hypothetical protein K0S23_852 [Fluviicola sp.]|jgi:hypothetical protein|uniref:DUF1761 domain-containing protein n=1 Tax=Fluviicola sp. TaxID=1917219 RepID=UPI00261193B8|nr:DUF1761 domain-containing protein [Fluviicola sp.]MDF3026545.1 hypothetical protein [Fluviicola sp.]